jgi:predicted RNase H-like nuclease (RuvC/YqgF family)
MEVNKVFDVKALLESTLVLKDDKEFGDKAEYWKGAAESLKALLDSQSQIESLKKELILLEIETSELEAELQMLVLQDKRLTNESQRKAALTNTKVGNARWSELTTHIIPGIKQQVESLSLKQEVLRKAYQLCYIAVTV